MFLLFGRKKEGEILQLSGEVLSPTILDQLGDLNQYYSVWLDLQSPTKESLALLGERFEFHPLALEDCLHFNQRPKVEEYLDHLFVVVHGIRLTGVQQPINIAETELEIYEFHSFL